MLLLLFKTNKFMILGNRNESCFVCGVEASVSNPLIGCSSSKCQTKFHDLCARTQNLGGYNYHFMKRDGGVYCPRHHCTACFADHNRVRAFLGKHLF